VKHRGFSSAPSNRPRGATNASAGAR
jgi:hypothetical protein